MLTRTPFSAVTSKCLEGRLKKLKLIKYIWRYPNGVGLKIWNDHLKCRANIKITKDKFFDNFIFEFVFHFLKIT